MATTLASGFEYGPESQRRPTSSSLITDTQPTRNGMFSRSPKPSPYEASFVADINTPDGATLSGDTTFSKTWRMRNTGTVAWPEGTNIVFTSGNRMTPTSQFPIRGDLSPGRDIDIRVDMRAPTAPGGYRSVWRLETPQGQSFGQIMWCQIVVPNSEHIATTVPSVQPVVSLVAPTVSPSANLSANLPTNSSANPTTESLVEDPRPTISPSGSPMGAHYEASFVADITVPDGATISGGAEFSKVWRMRNHGNHAWPKGTNIAMLGGTRMTHSTQFVVQDNLSPGREIDIGVDMKAPKEPGRYRNIWQLKAPEGQLFGVIMWCDIVVAVAKVENPTPIVPTTQLKTSPIIPTVSSSPVSPANPSSNPPASPHASPSANPPVGPFINLPTLPDETATSAQEAPEKPILYTLKLKDLSVATVLRDHSPVVGLLVALIMVISSMWLP